MTQQRVENAISHYYEGIVAAAAQLAETTGDVPTDHFEPAWDLPPLSEQVNEFFGTSAISGSSAGEYCGHRLLFLDLTGNPGTRTTKTFGSSIIVARALQHITRTGEPVLLVTPSAANKAVALRDAVLRAYETRCASPDELRVTVVVPSSSLPKLWDSPLLHDPRLATANPIGVYGGPEREDVKKLTTAAVAAVAEDIRDSTGFRVWYTLDPKNYMLADVVRAFFENEMLGVGTGPRWHAHTVSSAYGFLGHDFGRRILDGRPGGASAPEPSYLLVQHLETPDLVVNFHQDPAADYRVPEYSFDPVSGLYRQQAPVDRHFPETCYHPCERLERTFYTRRPATTPRVRELIGRRGGDGIVLSLPECLGRYQEVRMVLSSAGMTRLPEDPRKLHEWAMVMAVVGALTAIDRGLVPPWAELLVHGSGAYSEGEFDIPDRGRLRQVETAEDVATMLREAAETTRHARS